MEGDGLGAVPEYLAQSGAQMGSMVNKQGLKLASYEWPVDQPRGLLLSVHGVSCHTAYELLTHVDFEDGPTKGYENATLFDPRYAGSVLERFNQMGLVVAGIDLQSYGRSQGARGLKFFFESFGDHVADLLQFRAQLTDKYPGLPVFVLGGSMGGCIVTQLVQADTFDYAGALLMAPMLSLETLKKKPVNKVLLPVAAFVSRVMPTVRIAKKEGHPNPHMKKHFEDDPLNESAQAIRSRVAHECLKAVDKARANVSKFTCPLFVAHSKHDMMCDIEGSRFIYEHAGSAVKVKVELENEHMWHVLLQEPDRDALIGNMCAWIDERLTASGQAPTASTTEPAVGAAAAEPAPVSDAASPAATTEATEEGATTGSTAQVAVE